MKKVVSSNKNNINLKLEEFEAMKKEIDWYRHYGSYINQYFYRVDAMASEYADDQSE